MSRYDSMIYRSCGAGGLRLPAVTSVLIGASRPAQITGCVEALENLEFLPENLAEIEAALTKM